MAREVPIIDLAPFTGGSGLERGGERERDHERDRTCAAVDEALRRVGFLVVTNHGADAAVMSAAADAGRAFFDLDEAEKRAVTTAPDGLPRGYLPFGLVSLANTYGDNRPADIKESFAVGPERLGQNRWPARPHGFLAAMVACYDELQHVADLLLDVFARALRLPLHWFDDKFAGHNSTLRVFNYPAQTTPPLPGQLRAGAHTDYGAFTVLQVENDVPGGLQVQTGDGRWEDVDAPDGSLVVNVGDLLMMWTNDRWLSNVHRVVNPPVGLSDGRRQTIAFFANPRAEVLIECIESCHDADHPVLHPPVLAGQHRLAKVQASVPTT